MKRKRHIEEIRKTKKECDWLTWKTQRSMLACLPYDNCDGCGAFQLKKCEWDKKELGKCFLVIEEHTSTLKLRYFHNYECLDNFMHEKLRLPSKVVRL